MAIREAKFFSTEDIISEIAYEEKFKKMIKDPVYNDAAYDDNLFLNHIKCSPKGDRSAPSSSMWENCGVHVLKKEIEILSPEFLWVLGKGDNIYYLKNKVLNGELTEINVNSDVKLYYSRHFKKPLKIIVVPHPSSSIKESLVTDVYNIAVEAKSIR